MRKRGGGRHEEGGRKMRRKRERFTLRNLFCMWLMRWERRNERKKRNDGLSGAFCVGRGRSLPPSDVPQLPRARIASVSAALQISDRGRREKEGRNASIKKIVVIAIIAAAAAVITFIIDDVQRQEGGDLPFIPRRHSDDVDRGK